MKRNQGITLIELLVCVGIVVVLSAILFPVFDRAKREAQRQYHATHVNPITK